MSVRDLDPSLALGFYCGSKQEVLDLLERLPAESQIVSSSPTSSPHQLIEVVDDSERSRLFSPKARKAQQNSKSSSSNPYPPIDGEHQASDGLQGADDEDGETCLVDF